MGFISSLGNDYNNYFNPFNNGSGQADQDMQNGYNSANDYLNPYYQGGTQQWNNMGNWQNNQGQMLNGYGNPMDWAWKNANMSPTQWQNNIMAGYQESPNAQYATQAMERAMNNGASASGMTGSGAFYRALNQNANQISQTDQQQYFNNAMNSYYGQMAAGQNFQNAQNNWLNNGRWMAGMGYNAGNQMGQNAENAAYYQGQGDMANQGEWQQGIGLLTKAAMMGAF